MLSREPSLRDILSHDRTAMTCRPTRSAPAIVALLCAAVEASYAQIVRFCRLERHKE